MWPWLHLALMAANTFETEEDAWLGFAWLRRAHPVLDGDSPLEVVQTGKMHNL